MKDFLCIHTLVMLSNICSANVSLKDHGKDVNEYHDGHVVRVLICVGKDLSTPCIHILVHINDVNRDDKLPESYPSVKVFAGLFFLYQREQTLEIGHVFD